MYIQFVRELALENARNIVLELQKWKHFYFQINYKLFFNYCPSGKFLTLKFKFQVKSSDTLPPPPQLHMLRYVPVD